MSNIKKYSFLILACLMLTLTGYAQEEEEGAKEKSEILEKLVFGGNLGGGYANGWNLNISPTVGYKITDRTVTGLGLTYIYSDFQNPYYQNRTVYKVTGGRVFGQQLLFRNLYAHAEYEYLTYDLTVRSNDGRIISEFENQAPGLLLGGGHSTSFGYGLGFTIEVLYNVLYREGITPYSSPLRIRGGLMFGF